MTAYGGEWVVTDNILQLDGLHQSTTDVSKIELGASASDMPDWLLALRAMLLSV